MDVGFLHTHVLVNVLYMLFMVVKVVMLLTGKIEALDKLREKTKIADIVLGVLILVTGVYLLFIQEKIEMWMIVKTLLVLASIPLGIVGLKKKNKVLAISSLLIIIYVYGVAETKSLTFQKNKINIVTAEEQTGEILEENTETNMKNAATIYANICQTCHGADGKLGKFGAKDLTLSTLSVEEKKQIILKGKGMMQAFESQLSESEAELLVQYIDKLPK